VAKDVEPSADFAELNTLCAEISKKFGPVNLEYLSGTWRIWYKDWHCRKGASNGSLTGHGPTPTAAIRDMLKHAAMADHCGEGTVNECDDKGCQRWCCD
jgi:hypothetical protein